MRVGTVAWLLVSSNRCRTIIAKGERCVSKILGDADVSVGGWWNVEKEEGEGEGKNERWATSKKNTRRLVGKVRRCTGREEDEPRGEKTRGAKKKMEGGGATRPSDDLMSSPSPGLK